MQTGVVKWFNNAKGYGFILSDHEKLDVFAHYSVIKMDGYKSLKAGQCVAFEATKSERGFNASIIKIIEDFELPSQESSRKEIKEDALT